MAHRAPIRFWIAALLLFLSPRVRAQVLVDRIEARVDGDIILLSEMRELSLYQQLVNGRSDDRDALLKELIEQSIVKTEATAAAFPSPTDADEERALAELAKHFASREAFEARLRELGLSDSAVRRLLVQQILSARYLDYKFRPAAQVDRAEIEKYFQEEFVPQFQARGQAPPPLDAVRDQIRELLVQRGISRRAAQWLDEARSRLKVVITPPAGKEGGRP